MKLLSAADFERRHAELVDAKQLADADYRRACFALETNTGTEADVRKAKQHAELIDGKISGLASARQESIRLQGENAVRERQAAYKALAAIVEQQIAVREKAMAVVAEAGEKAAKAIVEHTESTSIIRTAVNAYLREGRGSYGPTGHSLMGGVNASLERGSAPVGILGAILDLNGVPVHLMSAGREALYRRDSRDRIGATDVEADRSQHLRQHIELLAPDGDAA